MSGRRAAAERRVTPRRMLEPPPPVRMQVDAGQYVIDAFLADISTSGIGVRSKRPLPPGRQFILMLPKGVPDLGKTLQYRVVRCRPLGQGEFHIGATFVSSPTPRNN